MAVDGMVSLSTQVTPRHLPHSLSQVPTVSFVLHGGDNRGQRPPRKESNTPKNNHKPTEVATRYYHHQVKQTMTATYGARFKTEPEGELQNFLSLDGW